MEDRKPLFDRSRRWHGEAELVALQERLIRWLIGKGTSHDTAKEDVGDAIAAALDPKYGDDRFFHWWVVAVVHRRHISRARREQVDRRNRDDLARRNGWQESQRDHRRDRIETLDLLRSAARRLPASYLVVIQLRYFGGLKMKEIAARLRVTPKSVERRLARALASMRDTLVANGNLDMT